ncbi:MAG: hypothetical protein LBV44_02170 [Methylobacillus sp.]|nr:hypothetical protein [Methylobacillus sp.]
MEPRWFSILLLLLIAARLQVLKKDRMAVLLTLGTLVLAGVAVWQNAWLPLKLYPFLVNLGMLLLFSFSLYFPPTVAERIARLRDPDLPEHVVWYTRQVTKVWCLFFILNGSVAFYLSFYGSDEIWTLYNGVIAYLLMGALFAIEYLCRLRFRRLHNG